MQAQGLGEMKDSASVRAPGQSGLTFYHILGQLQGELQARTHITYWCDE
jgi:hypothetical protein